MSKLDMFKLAAVGLCFTAYIHNDVSERKAIEALKGRTFVKKSEIQDLDKYDRRRNVIFAVAMVTDAACIAHTVYELKK